MMARPSHQPTDSSRKTVKALAAYGVTEADISAVVGVDPKTLRKHYRTELDSAHVEANAKVAESLFRKATGDGSQSVTAAIFWLKTRAQWKETSVNEINGSLNSTINVVTGIPRPPSDGVA